MRPLLLGFFAAILAYGVEIPAGTLLNVRLTSKLDSRTAKVKDPVDAVLIAPIAVDQEVVIPAGALIRGRITAVQSAAKGEDGRAFLTIDFNQFQDRPAAKPLRLDTRLTDVDNARETVDTNGRLAGINPSEALTSRMDKGIQKLGQRYGALAEILQSVKGSMLNEVDPEITYEPGVEMTLTLIKPFVYQATAAGPSIAAPDNMAGVTDMVNNQPFQTYTAQTPRPSDITNILFVGSAATLTKAFQEAGWVSPQALSSNSKMETFKAVAEMRGYKEGPFSLLVLDGQPPSMEFQKANNTFAKRHHLRIYRRPGSYGGQPIWVCSSTHDIGIDFSEHDRTFIHRIDPEIDRERAKVVSDLLFTGQVKALALIDRPQIPASGLYNATGDPLHTDRRMAVVILE